MSTHPEVLWAQRSNRSTPEKNIIYLTVNLPDIIESSLEYTPTTTSLSFKASTNSGASTTYAFDLNLFAEIDPEKSFSKATSRSFTLVLRKKELRSEYWPRLTKEKAKTPFIKTDFSKWVDEDEQDGKPNLDDDFGGGGFPGMDDGMDFSKMMAQMGDSSEAGAGASARPEALESDSESDDDAPPPLEDVASAA